MAPVKISHVVSFTSQDPKHPVENLLCEDSLRPWLSCPQDRSRQLRVELQLERASAIGYIDIGNCGCAFLQIEVGRSSWPPDQPYVTLVPCTTLMIPVDSKLDRNRSGVRMFKEGDFLASARGEKWDRLRVTCSQPFNKQTQFGLSFLRLRTPLDLDHGQAAPVPHHSSEDCEPTASPWLANPAFRRTFFPEAQPSTEQQEELRSCLQQLEPGSGSHPRSPAGLSRTARMVLSATQARARPPPPAPSTSCPAADGLEQQAQDPAVSPTASGPMQDIQSPPAMRTPMKSSKRRRSQGPCGRSPLASSAQEGTRGRTRGRGRGRGGRRPSRQGNDREETRQGTEMGTCPICAGCFRMDLLPAHASACGEDDGFPDPDLSWENPPRQELPEAWVLCPICELQFSSTEVEEHASTCGEQAGALDSQLWSWVE
ncbi:protein XNDC1N [Alligator mississippiensis]|uniref:protein XNDC1N n=1 Tax=Alligator mississippiensis TaxID=8496 RepID=UPI0028778965|nr:protein XNDC1N [Alligator mississippiensis]XP_019353154.2 protein XNDC1N [Alligator mississippiensis]